VAMTQGIFIHGGNIGTAQDYHPSRLSCNITDPVATYTTYQSTPHADEFCSTCKRGKL
jgi:hypothetical protein